MNTASNLLHSTSLAFTFFLHIYGMVMGMGMGIQNKAHPHHFQCTTIFCQKSESFGMLLTSGDTLQRTLRRQPKHGETKYTAVVLQSADTLSKSLKGNLNA